MKPIDPRLLREAKATTWFLTIVVALALFGTAATVVIAWAFSSFIVEIFVQGQTLAASAQLLVIASVAAAVRAIVHFLQEWAGFQASAAVKVRLRMRVLEKVDKDGPQFVSRIGSGSLSQLIGGSLDSLDVYFSKYLPQLVFTALVTPAFVIFVWLLDVPSGVVLVLTLPLIPLFMILIGMVTADVQASQLQALEKLHSHFLEVLKGLTTLKIFSRTDRQEQVLAELSKDFHGRTMKVLRVSFLSGFALELAASLSVALIAVSIGLRLVAGDLDLFTGLFVLLLAPEAYLPLRNVGAQFHAASDGVKVSTRVLDLLELKVSSEPVASMSIEDGITVVVGPSGSGKSRLLRSLANNDSSWLSQDSPVFEGDVRSNLAGSADFDIALANRAMQLAHIESVDLNVKIGHRQGLSGGQLQRVALARAFYRMLAKDIDILVLDEPTSQLDPNNQELVAQSLTLLASQGKKIIIATHQKSLISIADRVVNLDN